ncbi:hypothetical protein Tco_0724555 [Tanacetum coccineum]
MASTISSQVSIAGVGPGYLAAPELSPISYPGAGVVRQALFRGGISASGYHVPLGGIGLVVSGDGRGNGEDATGNGVVRCVQHAQQCVPPMDDRHRSSGINRRGRARKLGAPPPRQSSKGSSSSHQASSSSVSLTRRSHHLHHPLRQQGNQHALLVVLLWIKSGT